MFLGAKRIIGIGTVAANRSGPALGGITGTNRIRVLAEEAFVFQLHNFMAWFVL